MQAYWGVEVRLHSFFTSALDGGRTILRWFLKEMECKCVNWLHLAQDREQVICCEHGNEPSCSIKDGIS
jgi:hypothetical protein